MRFTVLGYQVTIEPKPPMMLDKFEPLSPIVRDAMLDLARIRPGDKHIDLGSGNGQFVVEATKRGAESIGYEIDPVLAEQSRQLGITVITDDVFNADVSQADVVTCWFSKLPETIALMDKLHREMKVGARLVKCAYTPHEWQPVYQSGTKPTRETFQGKNVFRVNGEIVCLYIKI